MRRQTLIQYIPSNGRYFRAGEGYKSFFDTVNEKLYNLGFRQVGVRSEFNDASDVQFDSPAILFIPLVRGKQLVQNLILRDFLRYKFSDFATISDFISHVESSPPLDANFIPIYYKQDANKQIIIGRYYPAKRCVVMDFDLFAVNNRIRFAEDVILFIQKALADSLGPEGFNKQISPEELARLQREKIDEQKNKFKRSLNSSLQMINDLIRVRTASIESATLDIIRFTREIESAEAQRDAVARMESNFNSEFDAKVQMIKELPFVKGVEYRDAGISVEVGKISILHNRDNVYIGDFTIVITPEGVRFFNKHKYEKRYDHPHVVEGSPCMGTHAPVFAKLLGAYKMKELVAFAYQFLNTYSLKGTPYVNMVLWKQFRDNEKKFDGLGNALNEMNAPLTRSIQ